MQTVTPIPGGPPVDAPWSRAEVEAAATGDRLTLWRASVAHLPVSHQVWLTLRRAPMTASEIAEVSGLDLPTVHDCLRVMHTGRQVMWVDTEPDTTIPEQGNAVVVWEVLLSDG